MTRRRACEIRCEHEKAARERAGDCVIGEVSMIRRIAVLLALCLSFLASCTAGPSSERHFRVGRAPGCVLVEDVNGDGRLDLVVANEKGSSVSVLLGDGKGGFSTAQRFAISRWLESERSGER